jgi:predicted small secreted protein
MKKVLLTVAALLALSMAFVGCNNNTKDESGDDTETPTDTSVVVLDASTWSYSGDSSYAAKATVDGDFIKVEATGWNNLIFLPTEFDPTGYSKLTFKMYAPDYTPGKIYISFNESTDNWPVVAELAHTDGAVKEAKEFTIDIKDSTKKINMIKVFAQEMVTYGTEDAVIYIGSVTASK